MSVFNKQRRAVAAPFDPMPSNADCYNINIMQLLICTNVACYAIDELALEWAM